MRMASGEMGIVSSMSDAHSHWNDVYTRKKSDEVSWFRPHLERSMDLMTRAGITTSANVIDVGGGASTLVDDLLARGHQNVSVLDLSEKALDASKERLGERARNVIWLAGDITTLALPRHAYDFWHDRAVFHFLRDEAQRRNYVRAVRHALKPGGFIVVATFGPDGPTKCSGLDVMRYSADQLHGEFGGEFEKLENVTEVHETPWGAEQQFVYCLCRAPLH